MDETSSQSTKQVQQTTKMAMCCFSNEVHDVRDPTITKKNHCTDFTFLLFFITFWIGLIFIAVFSFTVGSPLRLIHGSDSFGNVCGHENIANNQFPFSGMDMSKKPFLFHLNPREPKSSIKICVRKCPRENLNNLAEIYGFYTRTNSSLCRYDFEFTNSTSISTGSLHPSYTGDSSQYPSPSLVNETGLCPVLPVYATRSLLYHCVPELAITQGYALGHSIYDFISSYFPLKKVLSDIINAHEEMVIMGIVALVSAFASAFVIHFVANLASWIILVSISVLLSVVTFLMWWAYLDAHNHWGTFQFYQKISFLSEDSDNESLILAMAIICTMVTCVILYAASTLRSHVRFVVAIFHETAACIRCMPFLLIQPIWTLLMLMIFLSSWLFVMMALATANYESRESRYLQSFQTDPSGLSLKATQLTPYTLISYTNRSWVHYMWWYLVIALIWVSEFVLSCQQLVIAGAVSTWYFSRDRDSLDSPIYKSICGLFLRHLGSVALGSFLITLFKLPRLIIQQITGRLRQNEDKACARSALEACSCCLSVVERFMVYLTRNAYTVVVIERTNFCPSAQRAVQALVSNAIRVAAINSIGDFILFLGKLCVTALTAIVGIFLVRANPSLHYWTVPVALMSLFAFWVAHCLLSVYEMVIDAMFLCFCQEMNRRDVSSCDDYYAPESLRRFLCEDQSQMVEIRRDSNQEQESKNKEEENDYSTVN